MLTDRQILVHCISKAVSDTDLLQDIVEACEFNGISAAFLASGNHTSVEIAERLFLTEDEAATLLAASKNIMSLGGKFCDAVAQFRWVAGGSSACCSSQNRICICSQNEYFC